MLDGAIKTLQVDDSHTVDHLMITVCSKIGQLVHLVQYGSVELYIVFSLTTIHLVFFFFLIFNT